MPQAFRGMLRGIYGANDKHPMYSAPPYFTSARDRDVWLGRAHSTPSHPGGFRHVVSLLTTWQAVDNIVLQRRRDLLQMALKQGTLTGWREAFFNKRDYPLLACTSDHAASDGTPAIFSQYTNPETDDNMPMPALTDWRAAHAARFWAPARSPVVPPDEGVLPWKHRKDKIIFRGSATGAGTTIATNVRLRAASMHGSNPSFDFRLTSWNARHKIDPVDGVVRQVDPGNFPFDASSAHYMPMDEQAQYRYALLLDGNAGASRVGELLKRGFVILAPPSDLPQVAIRRKMQAGVHYLQVRRDLADVGAVLQWCRTHDAEAQQISARARELWEHTCTRADMLMTMADAWNALSPPRVDGTATRRALQDVYAHSRSAVYVLTDDVGRVRIFAPFANSDFAGSAQRFHFDEPSLQQFLRNCAARFGHEHVLRDTSRWWTNGPIVCNVVPANVWGESMLDVLRDMIYAVADAAALSRMPARSAAHTSSGTTSMKRTAASVGACRRMTASQVGGKRRRLSMASDSGSEDDAGSEEAAPM